MALVGKACVRVCLATIGDPHDIYFLTGGRSGWVVGGTMNPSRHARYLVSGERSAVAGSGVLCAPDDRRRAPGGGGGGSESPGSATRGVALDHQPYSKLTSAVWRARDLS
jgi:hypothetical protein